MGDFYELFYDDAHVAAKVLGLTLTSRDKNSENPIAMAGFPYHSLDGYLQKLIQSGHRAAICEQVEDPKKAVGLVKREVTRVVTPGTVTEDGLLDPRENNYLAAASLYDRRRAGLAWLEVSTGRFVTTDVEPERLADELARLHPAEVLLPDGGVDEQLLPEIKAALNGALVTERPAWCFAREECHKNLLEHFQVKSLEGFDIDETSPGIVAAGVLLDYLHETQRSALGHISRLEPYRPGFNLNIDEATRLSLELTHTMRNGQRAGSLLSVIDETVTPMGARLLSEWLSNPLTEIAAINRRLDAVAEFHADAVLCQDLREQLERTYDLQRLTARIATARANPRDLNFLAKTLSLLPKVKAKLAGRTSPMLQELEANLDLCEEVRADIEHAIIDDPPITHLDGGVIRDGFSPELDELRDLARGGKDWIAKYQAAEVERTGIPSMKVGFNKVFGYYLEVTAAHLTKVPEEYIRKQTLKNQERYVTPELKEHEEKVLRAEERAFELEAEYFQSLRERVAEDCKRLQVTADVLAHVDVLIGLAVLARSSGYCRPEIAEEPILDIREGRHPVLDRLQPSGQFVPNDVRLGVPNGVVSESADESSGGFQPPTGTASGESLGTVQIITGPNMAGKSTYIRQAALITVMAQMGSYVPASEARVGVADRIFARVGASDELNKGQSTFMVEMTETARILNSATERSLVILDEIGRGTSTYDGISLAWAITEHLHDAINCRTMFATHYHELTELTQTLKHASNWNVAVREQDDDVIFLHRIVEGSADKSYGIHVARLAGVPRDVIDRARIILDTLESDHLDDSGKPNVPDRPAKKQDSRQMSLFGADDHPVLDEIRELDIDHMTPVDALERLQRIRDELK